MDKKKSKKVAGTDSKPENKYLVLVLLGSFLLCVYLASSFKTGGDDDFFWHLATGRYIVENNSVPDKDIFGYVTQGSEWIAFEWGWDVLSYKLYSLGGYQAVLVFRSILISVTFLLYFLLLRKLKINSVISLLLLFLLLLGSFERLTPRPHLVTYFLTVLLMYLLYTYKYSGRAKYFKRLYFIPAIFLIWCNFHMGVAVGIAILLVFALSEIINFRYPKYIAGTGISAPDRMQLRGILIITTLSMAVSLINPHGINTYIYAYSHSDLKMLESIREWQSPFSSTIDSNFIVTIYKAMLFAGIALLIYAIKKKDLLAAIMYCVFALYSIRAIRFTFDFELVMLLFFALIVQDLYKYYAAKNASVQKVLGSNFLKIAVTLSLIFLSLKIQSNDIYHSIQIYRDSGNSLDENYLPLGLMNFMKENNIKGTPFNKFETGGILVWNFPDQKNFIDSRNLNDKIFDEYVSIYTMQKGFEQKLSQYGADYALFFDPELFLTPNKLKDNINSYFFKSEEWKLVYWDDKSLLFVKNIPAFTDVISRSNYKVLRPYDMYYNKQAFENNIKSNPPIAKAELERKSKYDSNGFFYRNMAALVTKYLGTN